MGIDLLLALTLTLPPAATVGGRVVDTVLRIPVVSATVVLESPVWRRSVQSDGSGGFRFAEVPSGEYALRVERSGYAAREVHVRVGEDAAIDVELGLDLRPVVMEELSVRAPLPVVLDGVPSADPAEVVPRLARAGMVRGGSPVAELGLAGLARDVRGQDPADPSDLLYVRGSALDLKLVLLDGAPVYTPFHMGGLLDPLETTTLSAARLHVGAAPTRLDGGLSYILELRSRPAGDRFATSGSVDLLSARATVETPVGDRAGILASARGASGVVEEALFDQVFGYGYRDALVRADIQTDAASNLRITGFGNREGVDLGEGLHDAGWGSAAFSAAYDRTGENGSFEAGASLARATGSIPRRTGVLDDLESRNVRLRAHADATRRLGRHAFAFGAAVERETLRERSEGLVESTGMVTWSGYGEVDLRAAEEVRLRGGLRLDVDDTGAIRPAPRLAATWLLSELTSLSITAGSYHQYVRDRGVAEAVRRPVRLRPARSSHVALALDQQIGEATRLELQGFLKRFTDLPTENGDDAYTSGIDVWAAHTGPSLSVWLGYSLVWLWAQPDPDTYAQRFSAHQVVSLGARGHITGGVFADATLTYGSGLALTGIDISDVAASSSADGLGLSNEGQSTLRPPPSSMARLDARIARTFGVGTGSVTPYFKIVNALDRRDALFFYDDDQDPETGGRPLATLPMLPLIGLEWRF